jgi:hypothetical protein
MYFAIVLTLTLLENYIKKVIFWDGRSIYMFLELGIGVLILVLLICFIFLQFQGPFTQKKRIHVLLR